MANRESEPSLAGQAPPADARSATMSLLGAQRQQRALGALTIAATLAIAWIVHPVAIGLLLGMLNAFMMQPFYERRRASGRSRAVASLLTLGVSSLGIIGVLVAISSLLVGRGVVVAGAIIAALSPGAPLRDSVEGWAVRVAPMGLRTSDILARLRDAAADVAGHVAAIAAGLATASFGALLGLFFLLMTTDFVLRRWSALTRVAEGAFPLSPRHTRALLEELRVVGRTTLLGTVITGAAQGALAAIGYLVAGAPEPAFLGAATAVASLVPAIGTLLVWLPVGVYLIAEGHVAMGIFELAWGAIVVVGVSDYIIRPRLIGGDRGVPALLTLAALFGGVETFGLIGLLIGPVVMALGISTLRIYTAEKLAVADAIDDVNAR